MSYEPHKPTFGVGARVKVVRQHKYPGEKLLGLVGTVRTDSGNNVSVIFDTITNVKSSYGCFYFKPIELVEVDEFNNEITEEKNMEKTVITNYLNIARVKLTNRTHFQDGVHQYANFDPDLKPGDICVVSTEDGVLVAAEVVDIVDLADIKTYREVVAKVDVEPYEFRLKTRAKAAEVKARMEARAKQLQDIALYQMLAKDDPDMAALLTEYQSIPMV